MNKEELVRDVKVGDSLGYSDHEMGEFRILREGSRVKSRTTALDFKTAVFSLFRGWKNLMVYRPRGKRGTGQMAYIQGSPSPSSRIVYPNK